MLNLPREVLAALEEDVVAFNALIFFAFPGQDFAITDSTYEVVANGRTYIPNSELRSADIRSLGDSEVAIAIMDYDRVWTNRFTEKSYTQTRLELDLYIAGITFPVYRGLCSQLESTDLEGQIRLLAKFQGIVLDQSKTSFLTDKEQRKRGGNSDTSLQYINETLDIAWGRLTKNYTSPTPTTHSTGSRPTR